MLPSNVLHYIRKTQNDREIAKKEAAEEGSSNKTFLDPLMDMTPVGPLWEALPRAGKYGMMVLSSSLLLALDKLVGEVVVPIYDAFDEEAPDEWDTPVLGTIMRTLNLRLWPSRPAGPVQDATMEQVEREVKAAVPVAEAADAPKRPSEAAKELPKGEAVEKPAKGKVKGEPIGLTSGRFTPEEQASIKEARARGEKFHAGRGITPEIRKIIVDAATKNGVDPNTMLTMAQIESKGNPFAVANAAYGGVGLFQFVGKTARQYGVQNRFDPVQSAEGAAKLMKDDAAALIAAGHPATVENLYLAHQQGAGGAVQILNVAAGKKGAVLGENVEANMKKNFGDLSAKDYIAKNAAVVAANAKSSQETPSAAPVASSSAVKPATAATSTTPSPKAVKNTILALPRKPSPAIVASSKDTVTPALKPSMQQPSEMFMTDDGVILHF